MKVPNKFKPAPLEEADREVDPHFVKSMVQESIAENIDEPAGTPDLGPKREFEEKPQEMKEEKEEWKTEPENEMEEWQSGLTAEEANKVSNLMQVIEMSSKYAKEIIDKSVKLAKSEIVSAIGDDMEKVTQQEEERKVLKSELTAVQILLYARGEGGLGEEERKLLRYCGLDEVDELEKVLKKQKEKEE